ncbi:MAG TPA: chemotaxis protein CheB [Terriglobales bacterium]|nr:chemotaxis protein CheB [Terriglobales bacterium]
MGESNTNSKECLIVAIGASAGGLEALEGFFKHMPADSGLAFAIVQHLAPDIKSALPELLTKYTRMPVEQVHDNSSVFANRVYVIAPNSTLTVKDGVFRVKIPGEPAGHRTPIDSLFRSVAEDRGENAVCIMLSGNGTDGTLGLRAIKEHGGMAMAQTLESAKYDAILRSAIATGLVDHVLPVEEMPAKLLEYASHLRSLKDGTPNHIRQQLSRHMATIHRLLRNSVGHDFSEYKENTIARRLERRMKISQIETVEQYLAVLEREPQEVNQLFKDLLIGVTQFFRDPEAFDALHREVIPKLFEGKDAGTTVRVCVVGCSSGEEAYSIAMLLCEHASTLQNPPKVKIFATDIDELGLEIARKGLYPESVAEQVGPERLQRFFTRHDSGYQVKRDLREMCVFSSHSFIKDPPFSRLDLISCRNVMIYLGLDLQEKIIPLFHYALRSGGYLFLGPAENAASHRQLFQPVDKKHRIFLRKESLPRLAIRFPLSEISRPTPPGGRQPKTEDQNFAQQLERIILQRFGPACVAVRENGDAVYFSGPISRYLEQSAGSPETNVVHMAREGLGTFIRTAFHKAVTSGERVVQKNVQIQINGGVGHVDLTVEPLTAFGDANLFIIAFEEVAPGTHPEYGPSPASPAGAEQTIRYLESELRSSQERLQATTEELETSNEELRSANEEYQSTNEELETSKEELQSFNEELETVNSELNRKVAELDHSNSDLQNLLNSTHIATIFLDRDLRIKNFTPAIESVFRLISSDIGRPITDLAAQFVELNLVEDIKEVLGTLSPHERELTGVQGRHYLMRILPYRTIHDVIDGVVITFVDVTQLKEAEQRAERAKIYAENIVGTVREPLLILDNDLRVTSANPAFYEKFRVCASEIAGQHLYELADGQWGKSELRKLIDELLPRNQIVENFEIQHNFADIGSRTLLVNARRIDHVQLILLAVEDITERKRAENLLLSLNEDLKHFSYAVSHDLQESLRMVTSYTQLLSQRYRGQLDDQANKFIAYTLEGAQRMRSLLRELREYWSVNERRLEKRVPLNSDLVLESARESLHIAIEESGATVSHDPLPTIMAEEVPLAILFQNLIGNAIKYRRPGEPPSIHVSSQKDTDEWCFSVADNGIGIDAKHLDEIFLPFQRLHGAEYAGNGIGLAMCKKIVERYGGRIWAESTPGLGSTFFFTIPA